MICETKNITKLHTFQSKLSLDGRFSDISGQITNLHAEEELFLPSHNSAPCLLGWWMILWSWLSPWRMRRIDGWGSGYPIVAHLVAVIVVQHTLQALDAISLIQLVGRQQVHLSATDTFVLWITCSKEEEKKKQRRHTQWVILQQGPFNCSLPSCVFKCARRLQASANFLLHSSQAWGLSPGMRE